MQIMVYERFVNKDAFTQIHQTSEVRSAWPPCRLLLPPMLHRTQLRHQRAAAGRLRTSAVPLMTRGALLPTECSPTWLSRRSRRSGGRRTAWKSLARATTPAAQRLATTAAAEPVAAASSRSSQENLLQPPGHPEGIPWHNIL